MKEPLPKPQLETNSPSMEIVEDQLIMSPLSSSEQPFNAGFPVSSPSDISFMVTPPSDVNDDNVMQDLEDDSSGEESISVGIEELLAADRTEFFLSYYDQHVCPIIAIVQTGLGNPFRDHVLPLAYEHVGLLHAILGLASCHLGITGDLIGYYKTEALKHRVEAIRCLAELLADERERLLPASHRDVVLAIINILVLHDICESGISTNGVHLRGAAYMCERLMASTEAMQSRRTVFLLGSLAWLDMMRGISGAEKLSFSQEDRERIVNASGADFEITCGCPKELFLILGDVMERGKLYLAGQITAETFERKLARNERELLIWNEERDIYPTRDEHWKCLADAFRHAAILRVLRFPDTFSRSADFPEVQQSVTKILDVASEVPASSSLAKRLLLPLFMAGADSLVPHQRHYILMRIQEIQDQTGFVTTAPLLLKKVWYDRKKQNKNDKTNVPWMEYVCLSSQKFYMYNQLINDCRLVAAVSNNRYVEFFDCYCTKTDKAYSMTT